MKKFLEELRKDRVIHYILIILAALISAIPLINLRIYGTDDGLVHILRILGVDNIIKSGQIPPYIYSRFCDGFGYVINVFYPPVVTYVPLIFKLFCTHYYNCLKIYSFITIIVSVFSMYKLVEEISEKREIALIAAIVYIFIPYKLATIYNRFAIGEFSAYMFLPLVFLGLYNLLNKDGKKHYYITIGAVGLLLTHTITTEYTAIFCLVYLLLNFKKLKNKEIIKKILINVFFILLISAFFLIPLLEYRTYADYIIFSAESMRAIGENVAETGLKLIQLFKDIEPGGVSFKLGITFTILSILGIFTYRKMKKEYKEIYLVFLLLALISLFMATKYFPWLYMPDILCKLQFAWRMLAFFEFSMSIIIAFNLYILITNISKNKKEYVNGLLLLSSVAIIILTMQQTNYDYRYEDTKSRSDEEYEQWAESEEKLSYLLINRDYLPEKSLKVDREYIKNRDDKVYIVSGNAIIENENKQSLNLTFSIKNAKQNTILELPFLYYPGYKVKIKNDSLEYELEVFESEYGFLAISVPEHTEQAEISVEYKGTVLEKMSFVISLIAIISFIAYVIYNKRKDKLNDTRI